MLEVFLRTKKYLIAVVAFCICSCVLTGCIESNFTLANESKLPRSMTLPPGLARTDVSVTLNFYAPPLGGNDAKFVLTDLKGKKLAEVKGKTKREDPSEHLRIVTEKGITEIIKLKPSERENMKQGEIVRALFYVIDDES